jgi:hypothetical protein
MDNKLSALQQADFDLLSLANEKGKFAIQLGYPMTQEEQDAFERGIDKHWFDLVDITTIARTPRATLMRVFRITPEGRDRLQRLKDSL